MSNFKDRLWRELVREHGADLAQVEISAAQRARRTRPRVLVGTTLGLAGLGATLALVLSAASSPPAFAVTPNRDGTVQVVLKRLSGISGANMKLASLGIRARIVEVMPGCKGKVAPHQSRDTGVSASPGVIRTAQAAARAFAQVRLDPRRIPAGRMLVLPTVRAGHLIQIAPPHSVAGAPPACLPPALPPMSLRPGHGRAVTCVAVPGLPGKPGTRGQPRPPAEVSPADRPPRPRRAPRHRPASPR